MRVDDTLSYDEQITNTVSARIARLCLINRVNYIFDTQTLLNIISALVCSKLYYNCSSVWGGGGDSHIKRAGMLVGKFQMNPKKVPICVWLKQNFTPKRYRSETQRQTISSMNLIAIKITTFIRRCLNEMSFN